MLDIVEMRKILRDRRLEIEERHLESEIKRECKVDDRYERTQRVAERKLELEERRFEFDRKEREEIMKLEMEERKPLIDLIKSMSNK